MKEEAKGFQILDGNVDEAYQQVACATIIQAAKDYQHYLLRPDFTPELYIATDLSEVAGAAQKAIKKKLGEDPNAVNECREFLYEVIDDCLKKSARDSWLKNVENSRKYIDDATTAEEMIDATHRFRMACSRYHTSMKKIVETYESEKRICKKFLTDGHVEFYSNGRLHSEAIMKLIMSNVEKELKRRERKRQREQEGTDH